MRYSFDISGELFDFVDFYESTLSLWVPRQLPDSLRLLFQNAILLNGAGYPKELNMQEDMYIDGEIEVVLQGLHYFHVIQHIDEIGNERKGGSVKSSSVKLKREMGKKDNANPLYLFEVHADWPPGFCECSFQSEMIQLSFDEEHLMSVAAYYKHLRR